MWGRERFLLNFDSLFIWPVTQSLYELIYIDSCKKQRALKLFLFSGEKSGNTALQLEVAWLRDALEAERTHSANLSISLDR
jgi:hypothetical protein